MDISRYGTDRGIMDIAAMIATLRASDENWRSTVSITDAATLRRVIPLLTCQRKAIDSRLAFVEMLLSLEEDPECDCDRRWVHADVDHAADCTVRDACTCERQMLAGGLAIADHAQSCALVRLRR